MSGVAHPYTNHAPLGTVARLGGRLELRMFSLPPQPLTSFVGRELELRGVEDLLRNESVRLLTLTGPGGVGKTRVALRLAEDMSPEFADGAAFVPLAAVVDPALVIDAVAHEFGVRDTGDGAPVDRLSYAIGRKQLLLVLDNFEQVVAAAPDVTQLLRACPRLKILVTSRVPLHVAGEQEYAIAPLAVPRSRQIPDAGAAESPAVALFAQRARAVRPEFVLQDDNRADVAAICARLDGLPLAIELAAARSKVLSPTALLARLSYPLDVLKGGPRDQPSRLQTMRDAIAWSHDLLPAEERILFRRMAVFSGGFGLEAAEAVGGRGGASVLDGLASLADKSLIWGVDGAEGEPRFGMLETVREFAIERLDESGEGPEMRHRHAAWCLDLANSAEPAILGPFDGGKLDQLETEFANLRAAIGWLEDQGETESALRLAASLGAFWYLRGRFGEGRERMAGLLQAGQDLPADVRAKGLFFAGWLGIFNADNSRAFGWLTEGLALYQQMADEVGVIATTIVLGGVAEYRSDDVEAWDRYAEALARARDLGHQRLIVWSLVNLTDAAFRRGDIDRCSALAEEALERADALQDQVLRGSALGLAAQAALARKDLDRAERYCQECLSLSRAYGYQSGIAFALVGLAGVAAARGRAASAASLLGAASAVLESVGIPMSFNHEQQRQTHAAARDKLTEPAFAAAWDAGRTTPIDDLLADVDIDVPGPSVAADRRDDSTLSLREEEVLRLLVAGQTDREIAGNLFISPRTVQGHVAHIFDKLGVNTRTAAVTAAFQSGLLDGDVSSS